MTNNPLSAAAIREALGSHRWQDNILVFEEVGSTNNLAKEMASQGAPEGTVLVADRQSAGRGRLGRSFLSPGDVGVYFSLILRPDCLPTELMHLTCAVAVAMCEAVEAAFGFRPGIKWTNDLVVGRKKLGGILTELGLDPKTGRVSYAVLGVGINCRQEAADFDPSIRDMACSAAMLCGQDVDRNRLIAEMIRACGEMSQTLLTNRAEMLRQYRTDCVTLDKTVSVVRGEEVFHAEALSVDEEGGLVIRRENGDVQTVTSGEVSVRGFYGYV